ncbi:MAG: DMT family transporter [Halocynthiibacter sp.]
MSTDIQISPKAWGLLFLLALIWGGIFFATRVALDEVSVTTAVAYRVFGGALVLWGAALIGGHKIPTGFRIWGAFLGMGLLNNLIPFYLMAWAQLTIESGLTSIFNAATALFGVLITPIFLKDEPVSLRKLMGVAIGAFGVATAIGLSNLQNINPRSVAQGAVLLGTISYVFAGIWGKLHLQNLPPIVAAAGMLSASSVVSLPIAYMNGGLPVDLLWSTWAAIAYYAIIGTGLAYLLYYQVLKLAGSANLMLVTLLISPIAIVLGVVGLGEQLTLNTYIGFGVLALGLLVIDGRLFKRASRK